MFPTLFRGAAYSLTNFVSRPVIGLGTFITEYTNNPMMIVSVMSAVNILATLIIREPDESIEIKMIADGRLSNNSTIVNPGREAPFNVSIRPEKKVSF